MDAQELRTTILQAVVSATTDITTTRKGAANGLEYAELTGKLDILSTLTDFLSKLDVTKPAPPEPADVPAPTPKPFPKKAKKGKSA